MNYCHHLASVVCKLFTFQASSLKPLGRLEPNLAGMFLGWSSTKLLFFVPGGYSIWLPRPIICSDWLKFQRSSSLKLMNWLNLNCTWMIMEYLCHKRPQIRSTCRRQFPVLSSFMTCHRICNYVWSVLLRSTDSDYLFGIFWPLCCPSFDSDYLFGISKPFFLNISIYYTLRLHFPYLSLLASRSI